MHYLMLLRICFEYATMDFFLGNFVVVKFVASSFLAATAVGAAWKETSPLCIYGHSLLFVTSLLLLLLFIFSTWYRLLTGPS